MNNQYVRRVSATVGTFVVVCAGSLFVVPSDTRWLVAAGTGLTGAVLSFLAGADPDTDTRRRFASGTFWCCMCPLLPVLVWPPGDGFDALVVSTAAGSSAMLGVAAGEKLWRGSLFTAAKERYRLGVEGLGLRGGVVVGIAAAGSWLLVPDGWIRGVAATLAMLSALTLISVRYWAVSPFWATRAAWWLVAVSAAMVVLPPGVTARIVATATMGVSTVAVWSAFRVVRLGVQSQT